MKELLLAADLTAARLLGVEHALGDSSRSLKLRLEAGYGGGIEQGECWDCCAVGSQEACIGEHACRVVCAAGLTAGRSRG
jgi:hypothetical protein